MIDAPLFLIHFQAVKPLQLAEHLCLLNWLKLLWMAEFECCVYKQLHLFLQYILNVKDFAKYLKILDPRWLRQKDRSKTLATLDQ